MIRYYKATINPFSDNKDDFTYEWINVNNFSEVFGKIEQAENDGLMVGLTNLVMTTRGLQSLLMLDYSISHSEKAKTELLQKITTFNLSGDASYSMSGFLIKTNTSYHYLSKYVTSQENFIHFLGSSLLFRHTDQQYFVVDDRWLGHSLKKGFGTIRISRKSHGEYPTIVSVIE